MFPRQTILTGGITLPKTHGRGKLDIAIRVSKSDPNERRLLKVQPGSPRAYELHVTGKTFDLHVSVPNLFLHMWRRTARVTLPTKGGLPPLFDALRYASARDGGFLRFVALQDASANIGIALALWEEAVCQAIGDELAKDRRRTGTPAQIRWRLFMALAPGVRKEMGRRQHWGAGWLLPTLAKKEVKAADAIDRKEIVARLLRPSVRTQIGAAQRKQFGVALEDGALASVLGGAFERTFKAHLVANRSQSSRAQLHP